MTPHKHAELIKAWADGAEIEYFNTTTNQWEKIFKGWSWDTTIPVDLRIKPERKPDLTVFYWTGHLSKEMIARGATGGVMVSDASRANLVLTFDGDTGKLKSAAVL